jgi:hypothetical protein
MSEIEELRTHIEILDGIQKAHFAALRLLLRDHQLKGRLHQYAEQLAENPPAPNLSEDCLLSMKQTLLRLTS